MTDQTTPRPKLRAGGGSADHRPTPASDAVAPADASSVPVRVVLLLGLVVLLLLAAFRPGGIAAVVGVPLAIALPGAVLQPRFLPGLHTDPVTRWCLRSALSIGTWALVALAVGAAGIPVRSVWPVVVGVVLLAAVVIGEPEGERRFGRLSVRGAAWGVVVVLVATALALGGRGLVALTDQPTGPGGGRSVVASFADPTVPLSLSASGARARIAVILTNIGSDDVRLTVGGRVGQALPWASTEVDLPAGEFRTVELTGGVPVCSDAQQAVVTVEGAGTTPPLSTIVPGAAAGTRCASG